MSDSITLSSKHGVNPSIKICAWCGEPTNEVILFGKLPKDAEAPKYAATDYEPCEKCKAAWEQGVAILEVTAKHLDNRPPISKSPDGVELYPTLRYAVIKREAASRLNISENSDRILMEDEAFNTLFSRS